MIIKGESRQFSAKCALGKLTLLMSSHFRTEYYEMPSLSARESSRTLRSTVLYQRLITAFKTHSVFAWYCSFDEIQCIVCLSFLAVFLHFVLLAEL